MQDLKTETLKLAGFVASHAFWNIRDGETLIPLCVAAAADGSKSICRFFDNNLQEAVVMARDWLARNLEEAACAAIAIDAFLTVGERRDAIVIDASSYEEPRCSFSIAVPYRPAKPAKLLGLLGKKQPLAIYHPKFIKLVGLNKSDHELLGQAFFSGLDDHAEIRQLWEAHYDPSK